MNKAWRKMMMSTAQRLSRITSEKDDESVGLVKAA
jgi:hypothetical protein